MESVAISFGSIILLGIVLYFSIKAAVRNGINESLLVSKEQRIELNESNYEEVASFYKDSGEEVPSWLKTMYGKDNGEDA